MTNFNNPNPKSTQENNELAREKIQFALNTLFQIIKFEKKSVKYLYIYAALAGIISLTIPLGIQTIIGFVLAGRLSSSWVILVVIITGAIFLLGLSKIAQMSIVDSFQRKLFVRYTLNFKNAISGYSTIKTETIVSASTKFLDIITLQKSFSKLITDFTGKLLQAVCGLILLCFYHPFFIIFGLLVGFIVYFSLKFTWYRGFNTARSESYFKFKTAQGIQQFANEKNDINANIIDLALEDYVVSRNNHFVILLKQAWLGVGIKVLLTATMLIIGSYLLVNQNISLGQFLASEILVFTLIEAIEKLILTVEYLYDAGISVEKLNEINEIS
jgi:ABC-type bacteriocin/lantibiotic exporter with double-glycine peptidase domain